MTPMNADNFFVQPVIIGIKGMRISRSGFSADCYGFEWK
jgi:hypothetical protein